VNALNIVDGIANEIAHLARGRRMMLQGVLAKPVAARGDLVRLCLIVPIKAYGDKGIFVSGTRHQIVAATTFLLNDCDYERTWRPRAGVTANCSQRASVVTRRVVRLRKLRELSIGQHRTDAAS